MFDYNEAFSRNIGWVTKEEQQKLRNTKVAIGGLGGVGGYFGFKISQSNETNREHEKYADRYRAALRERGM